LECNLKSCDNDDGTGRNDINKGPCVCSYQNGKVIKVCTTDTPFCLELDNQGCYEDIKPCNNQDGTAQNNGPCKCNEKVCTTATPFCVATETKGVCYEEIVECTNKDGTHEHDNDEPCLCRLNTVCTTDKPFCVKDEYPGACYAQLIKECTNTIGTISNFGSSNGTPCKCKKPKYDSLKPYEVCTTEKAFCDSVTATCRTSSLNPSYV